MADNPLEDAPYGLFRLGYRAFAWFCMIAGVVLLAILIVVMFQNTPSGTAASQSLVEAGPTLTVMAAEANAAHEMTGTVRVVDLPANCAGCHAIEGTDAGGESCPDLSDIGAVAAARLEDPAYSGSATTVEEYIRESIVDPFVYIVQDDPTYEIAPGMSLMPENSYDVSGISEAELDDLVTYLASLE